MCGIVGFINNKEYKRDIIKRMANRISHRGPDQEGYYIDDDIALGHRRLSIIDIVNGKQPMVSLDQRYVLIFNGEIYNYKQLKKELDKKYCFQTNCDTEVLLFGYQYWGKEMFKKLRGMFAFAIWDKEKKELFCARDHFGIKPFYFYKNKQVFMFASEIKAFLEHPQFQKELNKELIGPYLSFSFTPTNQTFFKDVYCLEPGTSLTYKNNKISIHKYDDIYFHDGKMTFEKAVEEIHHTMKDSIHHHLAGDCEVGAFLSSGVDSSYLVSLAKPDKTYTIGYDLIQYSEVNYAQNLTEKLGIQNKSQMITKKEYMAALPRVFYHMDEPLSDPSIISLYFLSKLASQDVKVIISGEGADEFFGGYNYYKNVQNLSIYQKLPFSIRHLLALVLKRFPEWKGRNFIIRNGMRLEDDYIGVNKIWGERERKKILKCSDLLKNKDITKPIFKQYQNNNDLNKMQAVDIRFWLLKDILLKADKMTMAHSIEGRIPFVDKNVFQIACSLPMDYKVTHKQTKVALREAAKKSIPNDAYKKKKLGFPVPVREWMREDDVYFEMMQTFNQDFVAEFFNQKYLLKLLKQHRSRKKDHYRKIWSVYSFVKWYEVFFLDISIEKE